MEGQPEGYKTCDFERERYDFCGEVCLYRWLGELDPEEIVAGIYSTREP